MKQKWLPNWRKIPINIVKNSMVAFYPHSSNHTWRQKIHNLVEDLQGAIDFQPEMKNKTFRGITQLRLTNCNTTPLSPSKRAVEKQVQIPKGKMEKEQELGERVRWGLILCITSKVGAQFRLFPKENLDFGGNEREPKRLMWTRRIRERGRKNWKERGDREEAIRGGGPEARILTGGVVWISYTRARREESSSISGSLWFTEVEIPIWRWWTTPLDGTM